MIKNKRSKRPGFLLVLLRIFAHIIDFRSYVDATMSLYSIIDLLQRTCVFFLVQDDRGAGRMTS